MTGAEILAQRAHERGRLQALRAVLLIQLEERFGALPESIRERIDSAATDELEQWTRRIIRTDSLDHVFATA